MTYLCAQRSDLDKSRYWGYQEIELYKLVLTISNIMYKTKKLEHFLAETFSNV